ncbi:hypothetical protein RHGRI_023107 [Rhododendron griersonianum]|uniref:Cytochrome P450 n=1 Tax=Rhododendron griersonianum TaxID=479676 RepID=A0AAV6J3K2_9ERIC|nr:hypothetical protein RHGRI_023107 [Rhododendron griersonianum]
MAVFVVGIGVVLGLCFCTALLRWNEVRYRKKGLPPGTMGWPIFGETTEFLKQGPNFMKKQRARYGSFFKSHILGCPTIVSMDPELNRYILMNESKGLVPGYPQSMLDILGKCNIAAVHGLAHRHMRGALLALVSSNVIRDRLLQKIDGFMRSHLSNWEDKMALLSSLNQIAGLESIAMSQEFMPEFFKLVLGTLSLPINLPGTNYHRGFQARKNIVKMLTRLVDERRASGEIQHDMLGVLMNGEENRWKLSDEEIIDQMITILYSGYETVSTTSMMAVKYLQDHPNVLRELRKEHLAIRQGKRPEDPIDWEDFKAMRFTRADFLFQRDGEYMYIQERSITTHVYIPSHLPSTHGDGWTKVQNLRTTFSYLEEAAGTVLERNWELQRWEEVGGEKLRKFPRVEAPNGLHIRVSSYSTDNHLSCVQKSIPQGRLQGCTTMLS